MKDLVLIERNIGGTYVISRAVRYETAYYADYTAIRFGVNIFGQSLTDLFPKELSKMRCIQTRIKAGVALSGIFKNEVDAMAWAKSKGYEVFTGSIHSTI